MTQIARQGLTVDVPPGWDAELSEHPGHRVVLHMTDGPLPRDRADFGGHALESLPAGGMFLALLEYSSDEANTGLFQSVGVPAFAPADFSTDRLHRFVHGQTGAQRFFSMEGRSFCCYAVLASTTVRLEDVYVLNRALQRITFASIS